MKSSIAYRVISKLVVVFIVLLVLFIKAVIDFPEEFEKEVSIRGWVHFTSSEGDFVADFPSKPMTQQKQFEIPQAKRTLDYQEVTTHPSNESIFSVSALALPKKWMIFSSRTILKGALSVLVDNMAFGAKLLHQQLTRHGEYPAIDYHIQEDGRVSKGRLVLVNHKLFKVEFSTPTDLSVDEEGGKFIHSFKPFSQRNP